MHVWLKILWWLIIEFKDTGMILCVITDADDDADSCQGTIYVRDKHSWWSIYLS